MCVCVCVCVYMCVRECVCVCVHACLYIIFMCTCYMHSISYSTSIDALLVTAYHPDSYLTLGAINKLQIGASINLLPVLEKSPESLGDLQRLAGFDLSGSIDPFYCKNSMIPKYINKWTMCSDHTCSRRSTWRNFLSILRELKEVSIAEQIERYLEESTAYIENSQVLKPFDGKNFNTIFVFIVICKITILFSYRF